MSLRNLVISSACMIIGSTQAFGLVIDGGLSDWGASVADNNHSTYAFSPGLDLLGFQVEDQDDSAGLDEYLGPNYGGQKFDAEMMAVAYEGGRLCVTIVSGQRPDNGFRCFAPGDIRVETSAGTYGIEVGGGKGADPSNAITTGAVGSTYTLDSSGYTTKYDDANPLQVAGSIWSGVNWLQDPIAPTQPTQFEIDGSSTLIGLTGYVYTRNDVTGRHAIIELSFDVGLFAGETIETIHWRPSCGNDELDVSVNFVPEPAGLIMLAFGGMAAAWSRRRR